MDQFANETGGQAKAAEAQQERRWTLIGDVSSGKTFMTFAALQRREQAKELGLLPVGETDTILAMRLQEHMQDGKPSSTSSDLVEYRFRARSPASGGTAVEILLSDGPGGHAVRGLKARMSGQQANTKLMEAAGRSDGLLLFLPHHGHKPYAGMDWIEGLRSFIDELVELWKGSSGRKIALCLSKVDQSSRFAEVTRSQEPMRMSDFTKAVYREIDERGSIAEALATLQRYKSDVTVAVFAVSSFGSVRLTGRPNTLPGLGHPLVYHLTAPTKTGRRGVPLYTRAFTDAEVNRLWVPFNVHAPLFYLLEGKIRDDSGVMLAELTQ